MKADEYEQIVEEFEACSLDPAAWNHKAHLVVAAWYLTWLSPGQALARLKVGLKRYNGAHPESVRVGYHETLTVFWLSQVAYTLAAARPGGLVEAVDCVLQALGDSKKLPLEYYDHDSLFSGEAREAWVEPRMKRRDFPLITECGQAEELACSRN